MEKLKEEEKLRAEIEMELFFLLKARSKDADPVSHRPPCCQAGSMCGDSGQDGEPGAASSDPWGWHHGLPAAGCQR